MFIKTRDTNLAKVPVYQMKFISNSRCRTHCPRESIVIITKFNITTVIIIASIKVNSSQVYSPDENPINPNKNTEVIQVYVINISV